MEAKEMIGLTRKVCNSLGNRYRLDKEETFSEALCILAKNIRKYAFIENEDLLYRKMYSDIRKGVLKYKTINMVKHDFHTNEKGEMEEKVIEIKKRAWTDPNRNIECSPLEDVENMYIDVIDTETLKSLFYEHLDDFNLDYDEKTFIDMCFSGLDIEEDYELFKQAFPNKSKEYLQKGFYYGIIRKLEEKTPFAIVERRRNLEEAKILG